MVELLHKKRRCIHCDIDNGDLSSFCGKTGTDRLSNSLRTTRDNAHFTFKHPTALFSSQSRPIGGTSQNPH
jgi:hypothetical protein